MSSKLLICTTALAALTIVATPVPMRAQASKTPPKAEVDAWQKAKAANTFDAAVDFVKNYPDSTFVAEARTRFPRPGKKNYEVQSMTANLYLANGEMFAIVEIGGRGNQSGRVSLEDGLSMIQTRDEKGVWYDIVSSDRVAEGADTGTVIKVVSSNLHVYLISNISFNFTGRIKPL